MANTTNLNLYKPSRDDYISVTRDISDNMQKIDDAYGAMDSSITNLSTGKARSSDIGIVVTGNTSTKNITAGDFVVVMDSTISGVTDGLYIATANVTAGSSVTSASLSGSDTGNGGFNALKNAIDTVCSADVNNVPLDLDYCTKSGVYFCTNLTQNKPTTYGICVVYSPINGTSMNEWVFQVYYPTDKQFYYTRRNINQSGWTNWNIVKETHELNESITLSNEWMYGMYSTVWNVVAIDFHDVNNYQINGIDVYFNNTWVSLTNLAFNVYGDFKQCLTGVPPEGTTLTDGCYLCRVSATLTRA